MCIRDSYLWVTVTPMLFVAVTTTTAGVQLIMQRFWPLLRSDDGALRFRGGLNAALTIIMLVCVIVILADAARRWLAVRNGTATPVEPLCPAPYDPNRPPDRCC